MKTKHLLLSLLFLLFTQVGWGQTQIYVVDFESAAGYSTTPAEFSDGGTDYFTSTFNNTIGSAVSVSNIQGTYFFGAQDIDADQPTEPCIINIDDVNISGYTNLEIRVYLAEDDDGSNQDWDAADYVHFDYDIDNTGSFSDLLWIESSGATNTAPFIDTDYDGTGDGTEITSTFVQFTQNISGTGSLLDIRITIQLESGDEDIAIDHIEIYGTSGSSNDTDSEAYDSGSQPAAANIASTSTAFTDVFEIEIEDIGTADGLDTKVTNIRVKPHSTNTADWTDHINAVKLNNGSDITIGTVDITDTYIDIPITSGDLDITDGGSDVITLQIQINNTGITDNAILSFMVDADDHGFTADNSGSSFENPFTLGDFNSNDFTIRVTASELNFVQEPSNTVVSVVMSPDPTVAATDANGNIDVDYSTAITVTS
ncbi:MAG: hypothetical protein JXR36_14925, partial [Bacteroidales bacterium]|nr:hypothetical protein [Bacteroidales bacterium]